MIFSDPGVVRSCRSLPSMVLTMCVFFGSVARGEAKPPGDIDLLVEFKRGTTLLDHAALAEELEELLGVKVNLVSERGLRERIILIAA